MLAGKTDWVCLGGLFRQKLAPAYDNRLSKARINNSGEPTMKHYSIAVFTFAVLAGCAGKGTSPQVPSEQRGMAERPVEAKAAPQAIPQMSPEEMMAKMKDAATPGQEHKELQPLVGKWKTVAKWWMDPSKAPDVSKGTANHQWAFGKRFIKEEYNGKWGGQPFQGMGMLGYDRVKKAYISTWLDSMGTGIMTSEGKFEAATRSIEMSGKYSCPMTGGDRQSRIVTRIVNNDQHVFEMFDRGPDGKEFKNLEITYTRVR